MKFPHTFISAYRTRALHVQVNNIEILLKSQPLFNKSNKYINIYNRSKEGHEEKEEGCVYRLSLIHI